MNHPVEFEIIYRFTDLSWGLEFIPGRCLFNYIKITTNGNPARLTSNTGYGLRSVEFSHKFPNLKRVIVKDRGNIALRIEVNSPSGLWRPCPEEIGTTKVTLKEIRDSRQTHSMEGVGYEYAMPF